MLQEEQDRSYNPAKAGCPLLFGKYLMDTCALVSLEDISALPAYSSR